MLLPISVVYAQSNLSCRSNKSRLGNVSLQTAPANLRSDTIDILNTNISLSIIDFIKDTIRGNTAIKFAPKINGQNHIILDLLTMKIDSVTYLNQKLTYLYNDTLLNAYLPGIFNTTDTLITTIYYHGIPKADPSGWGGFAFSGAYAYNLGVGFSTNFHNFGRCWFPCFDNFIEKCTFQFNIISPPNKRSVCNGVLTKDSLDGSNYNYRVWILNKPIPSYLASVAVNNYVFVQQTFNGISANVPVKLAALATDTNAMKNSFVHLQDAFNCFESHYGPFAWPRVGYVLVPFNSGAMEHATNIAYPLLAANGALTYEDKLMAHELSHHWWGDLVTCETAQEMYINEGMASYNQSLFNECVYGQTIYRKKVLDNHDNALHNAHFKDKGFLTLSNVPLAYTYGDHSYNKGADLVYTLRSYVGDSLFFVGTKYVLQQKAYSSLNSVEFSQLMTIATGYNTSDFFTNWINNPGWPHFSIDSMNVVGNNVTVYIRQRLFWAPQFYQNVPLDILFLDANRNKVVKRVNVSSQYTTVSFTLPFSAVYAGINFNNRISDAITSEYKTFLQGGYITYTYGRATLGVYTLGADSNVVRVEHNFIKPDAIKNNINNYILGNQHYWKIDGILSAGFRANLKLYFNGKKLISTISGSTEYSDTSLTKFTSDSIIVLYRKNTADDWREVSSYTKTKIGGTLSIYGYVLIDTLKLGEYCFANGKSNVIGIKKIESEDNVKIYPNPANDKITIDFNSLPNEIICRIYSVDGKKVLEKNMTLSPSATGEGRSEIIDISSFTKGYYLIKLEGKDFNFTQKLIVNGK